MNTSTMRQRLHDAARARRLTLSLTPGELKSASGACRWLHASGVPPHRRPVLHGEAHALDLSGTPMDSIEMMLTYLEQVLRARTERAVTQGRTSWGSYTPHATLAHKLRASSGLPLHLPPSTAWREGVLAQQDTPGPIVLPGLDDA